MKIYYTRLIFIISIMVIFSCGRNGKKAEEVIHNKDVAAAVYSNPVFNQNFPDPTVIKAPDGYYYAYGTNTSVNGEVINIQVLRSKDLIKWTRTGDALPEKPSWAENDFWAPHVFYDKEKEIYFLYYSGESKSEAFGKCLGVATSPSPLGPFVDKGEPLLCGEGFINIDPMTLDDPETGRKFLYWGSGFGAIKIQELSDDRINFKESSTPKELIQPITNGDPENYQNLVEGAWINQHGDYFYMYYSGDNCCGEEAHYAVMVARSKNPTGPFQSFAEGTNNENSVILEANERWIAPGHNSIVTDDAGQDWVIYHAIDSRARDKGRLMLIDKIKFENGWPVINDGSPSTDGMPAPVIN